MIHSYKYNYDKVIYINQHKHVTITCPVHGDFQQTPMLHLRGNGCAKCFNPYYEGRTKKDLIQDLQKIHHGKYSYQNLPDWSNNRMYINIICPKHGLFRQRIANHLRGDGCPSCRNSKQENILEGQFHRKKIRYVREKTFPWLVRKKTHVFRFLSSGIQCSHRVSRGTAFWSQSPKQNNIFRRRL